MRWVPPRTPPAPAPQCSSKNVASGPQRAILKGGGGAELVYQVDIGHKATLINGRHRHPRKNFWGHCETSPNPCFDMELKGGGFLGGGGRPRPVGAKIRAKS